MHLPGGPSAHVDKFARDLLPPPDLWPVFDYSAPHLKDYPDRINAAVTLLDQAVADGFGDKVVFHYGEGSWTYAQLLDKAERIARVLVEDFGLVPGNRVLMRSGNTPMVAACWLAVLKAGGICVMSMSLLRAKELGYLVDKAKIRIALCEESLAEEMELTRAQKPDLAHVAYFTPLGDGDAGFDRMVGEKPSGFANVDTAADDVAAITFTSGTTGNPKGAMHFHRDILAVTDCWPQSHTVEPDEIIVGSPSFAFTYGLAAFLTYPLRYRATAVLVAKPTPDLILDAIQRHKCTSLYAVPTSFHAMLQIIDRYDVSSLRKCSSAGEHLRVKLYEDWLRATGLKLINGIGMTEMLTHFIAQTAEVPKEGATGRPVPGYCACILDDDDNPLPPGNRGRLAVRGPTGCRYLDDEERQAKFVRQGWNVTGDIMEEDAEGWFWYVDRSDDMIVSSGYNISAQEVERVILEHPRVFECAVVGVPDEARGNIVRACIVLDDPSRASEVLAEDIQNYVKAAIAPYKYPREIKFLEVLPKTQTGKVQRFRLRQI
ncbi:2-aminobenzoate-CoA ligase [Paramagnetospirillum kuznetsovii]|uniref:2-aminobenzoate-CoA ligase n=2 Tax=Paramagnetospirillum kuznetsovii TaxID=2053833 RepID=A0A364NX85_9PROT|nr:2-aminobenzoate-CoA ligase [Paramagnetospirillum kuznetsovii]